jgi:DNA repair exonuclease SbcCD nuclease subunit
MNKFITIGDLHFSSRLWWPEVGEKFLKWFEEYDFGAKNNIEALFLGDITDKDVNPGDVIDIVCRLANICQQKFSKTYFLTGNHDMKLFTGKLQYSIKFLRNFPFIHVIDKEEIIMTPNGFKFIALPYQRIEKTTLEEYYSEHLDESFYNTKADVIVGHVAAKEPNSFFNGVDFSKFATKELSLGHIHSRFERSIYKKSYNGSIAPFKISEDESGDLPRVIKEYSVGKEMREIEIPRFLKYETIKYPDKIQITNDNITRIYTVSDCKNKNIAESYYDGFFIKGVEKQKDESTMATAGEKAKIFASKMDAFKEMIKENNMNVSRKVYSYIKSLFEDVNIII